MSLSRNLSVYRGLLREVNIQVGKSKIKKTFTRQKVDINNIFATLAKQYTKGANNPTFAQELKSIYRKNQDIKDPSKIKALNGNAEDVLTFLTSSRKHKINQELRALYSAIVLEQKKKIELSANRVGLNLPKQYDPENPQPLTSNKDDEKN
ncbi:hypothetical protein [Parasitella parasitica]|uniref:Uncharacterized protein n=1 Tax=Parasitella parasitica TaxID=35722 RepID=A0A0B7NE22_9FUNG|nr:hypothetical protein [Parasitella parasitica]